MTRVIPGNNSTGISGWTPTFGVDDSSNGTPAVGGSGYVIGEAITLNDGGSVHAVLTVTTVSGGTVTGFNITNRGNASLIPSNPVGQLSSSGAGTGATFTLSWDALASGLLYGTLVKNSGNLFLGGETPSAFSGTECTFVGDRAGGNIISGAFTTLLGHNAGGIGAGTSITGATSLTLIGTDAGRNIVTGATRAVIVGDGAAENMSSTDNTILGHAAAFGLTSGNQNVVIGGGNPTGTTLKGNVIIGFNADVTVASSRGTVIIGSAETGGGAGAHGGEFSVIIGARAGRATLTGGANNIIGYRVGSTTLTTGIGNYLVGASAAVDTPTAATNNYMNQYNVITVSGMDVPGTSAGKFAGTLGTGGFTVATLPAASAALTGARAYVTDALAPTFLAAIIGGGLVTAPVFCDGSQWVGG